MLEIGCVVNLRNDIKDSYLKYCTMKVVKVLDDFQVVCKIIKNKKYTIKNKWKEPLLCSVQNPFTIVKNELVNTEITIAIEFLE